MKAKILSMIEVSVVFVVMIFLFRYVNAAPLAAEASRLFPGRLFPGYAVLLIASLLIYFFQVLRKPQSPLSEKLKYQLSIAAQGFFPIFTLSVLLNWIN